MKIIDFNDIYSEALKDLLVELQEYIVSLDPYKLNIVGKNYREKYYEKTIKDVNSKNGKIFLAKEKNKIVGAIIGYLEQYDENDKVEYLCPEKAIISELIVSSKDRNSGVGEKLLKHAESYFKQIGCKYISIELFAYNKIAKKFYNKHQYENRCINLFKKL